MKLTATLNHFLLLSIALLLSVPAMAARRSAEFDDATLEVSIADHVDGHSERRYEIVTRRGKRFALKVRGTFPDEDSLLSGHKVKVKGRKLNSATLRINASEEQSFQVTSQAVVAGAAGVRQALVLKIQSESSVSSASVTQISNTLNTMRSALLVHSYGDLDVQHDIDGNGPDIYTVAISGSSAGLTDSSAFTLCRNAQTNSGLNTSQYDHIVCVLPPDMNYSWFGQAYLNGREMVISGKHAHAYAGGYEHEFGHNFGMHHANTASTEYGDSSGIMGGNAGTAWRHFNGPHKLQMGWVPATSAGVGQYELNALEAQPQDWTASGVLLKLFDPVANEYLYISYRAQIGSYTSSVGLPGKTSIHTWAGSTSKTIFLSSLGDGQIFTRNGITIEQISHTDTTGLVSISADCASTAPQVVLTPAEKVSNSGSTETYTLSITNANSLCEAVDYSISFAAPDAGWNIAADQSNFSLGNDESAAISLDVTSPAGVNIGQYTFSVTVAASTGQQVTKSGKYILDTQNPAAITDLSATLGRKGRIDLRWSEVTDASGISQYEVLRDGAIIASTTGTSYSDRPGSGTFAYQVRAIDSAGNVGDLADAVVVSTSGGGGKGGSGGGKGGGKRNK